MPKLLAGVPCHLQFRNPGLIYQAVSNYLDRHVKLPSLNFKLGLFQQDNSDKRSMVQLTPGNTHRRSLGLPFDHSTRYADIQRQLKLDNHNITALIRRKHLISTQLPTVDLTGADFHSIWPSRAVIVCSSCGASSIMMRFLAFSKQTCCRLD